MDDLKRPVFLITSRVSLLPLFAVISLSSHPTPHHRPTMDYSGCLEIAKLLFPCDFVSHNFNSKGSSSNSNSLYLTVTFLLLYIYIPQFYYTKLNFLFIFLQHHALLTPSRRFLFFLLFLFNELFFFNFQF